MVGSCSTCYYLDRMTHGGNILCRVSTFVSGFTVRDKAILLELISSRSKYYQFVLQAYNKMEDTSHVTQFTTLETTEVWVILHWLVGPLVTAGDKKREVILSPVTIP